VSDCANDRFKNDDGNRTMSSLPELQALIKEKYGLDPSKLDPHASLRASGVDSLALVEFLFEVEDRYKLSVPDEYSNIDSLAELAEVIDKLKAKAAAQ
jgi:acyl carrier protein